MNLTPWSHPSSAGFTLRGWRSEPTGKPLLHFLHGNGFCGRTYEPMLEPLAEHFDLWLCDAQGHGASDAGPAFIGWNASAQLATEAFRAGRDIFGSVPRYALGHSFGGVLSALMLAEHPTLFNRALLLDPVLFSPTLVGLATLRDVLELYRRDTLASRALRRRRHWPDRQAAVASLRGRGMFAGWQEEALQAYGRFALKEDGEGVTLCCTPEREAEVFASSPRRMWPALARVETPTHVLVGEHSFPFVHRATRRWCAMNARISREFVAGGHCFMQERPAEAAERVIAYLLR